MNHKKAISQIQNVGSLQNKWHSFFNKRNGERWLKTEYTQRNITNTIYGPYLKFFFLYIVGENRAQISVKMILRNYYDFYMW